MNREDYILFIDSGLSNDGVGFFIGNTFITAGHVIEDAKNPYIVVNDKRIALVEPVLIKNDDSSEGYDIAVFRIPDVDSPLILNNVEPEKGDKLTCYYWMGYGKDFIQCRATVKEEKEGR